MTTAAEPIHPGEHLAEMLEELGVSQYRLAKTVGVPAVRINDIVHCRRSITADTALRIGRALRMTPEFWLNLQRMYDLDLARREVDVSGIEPLFDAPDLADRGWGGLDLPHVPGCCVLDVVRLQVAAVAGGGGGSRCGACRIEPHVSDVPRSSPPLQRALTADGAGLISRSNQVHSLANEGSRDLESL